MSKACEDRATSRAIIAVEQTRDRDGRKLEAGRLRSSSLHHTRNICRLEVVLAGEVSLLPGWSRATRDALACCCCPECVAPSSSVWGLKVSS